MQPAYRLGEVLLGRAQLKLKIATTLLGCQCCFDERLGVRIRVSSAAGEWALMRSYASFKPEAEPLPAKVANDLILLEAIVTPRERPLAEKAMGLVLPLRPGDCSCLSLVFSGREPPDLPTIRRAHPRTEPAPPHAREAAGGAVASWAARTLFTGPCPRSSGVA